ncbi:helix-turn-helix domain-containing protein [Nesterenkonia pannonica]|uniref:PucR family transcriptional regulator n=1 Tax=Nesterenkonia pannonica TaxID=1548602 RepID=UPI00216487F5|nr:helix-turn-helix domain-containing protein [Nesterenkonia pannonica]
MVEVSTPSQMMSPLIQPVTAVLAMHLAAALGSTAVVHSRGAGRLVGAIFARSSIATEELVSLAQEAELDPYRPIGAVVLQAEPGRSITYLRTLSWRIRTRLAAEYPTMRFVEDADMSTMLVQGRGLEAARLQDSVRTAMGRSPAARGMVDAVVNAAELGLVLRHMRRCVDASTDAAGVRRAPPMSFDALVDALRHPGTESMARRLVAPLAAAEHAPLRETLEVFLRSSGTTAAVCDELFIHRNTLAHRIRKIEELLGIGLQDGQSRALLMLSLRLA